MSMSDAYTRCEELGIDTTVPDALGRLWEALTPAERPEIFPFARNYESETFTHPPVGAGPGGYVLTEPAAGQWRMWNGTAGLVFQVVAPISTGMGRVWKIRYTSGEEATSSNRELYQASHEVMAPADNTSSGAPLPTKDLAAINLAHAASRLLIVLDRNHVHHDTLRDALQAYQAAPKSLPVRGRPLFPPTQDARRARELAAEHIRRARVRLGGEVPSGGRPWRPGDETRTRVLNEAADNLARLCAVYLGAREGSPRNRDEAHAYALAFRLVSASARRLAHRRIG